MSHRITIALAAATLLAVFAGSAAAQSYEGRKKCSSCHKSQAESWGRYGARQSHGLAQAQHQGRGQEESQARSQERLHQGQGLRRLPRGRLGQGRRLHRGRPQQVPDAAWAANRATGRAPSIAASTARQALRIEKSKKTAPRQTLADAGQDFSFEESCNACHLNYKGSPWKGAKEPYTPFTPEVDKKYTFNFDKYVKDAKAMHEHYKLDGTFTGDPKFKYHDDFQASAKVGKKAEVED